MGESYSDLLASFLHMTGYNLSSRWIPVGEHRIHTRVPISPDKTGRQIVLVHGLVISSLYMVPTAVRLAGAFPLFAPDLPGFGKSSKPERTLTIQEHADVLAEWAQLAGVSDAIWVGNSYGCQIIAEVAVRYPSLVPAAVLAGPTMDPHGRKAPVQISRWLLDWLFERPSLAAAHVRDYAEAGLRRAWLTFQNALADPIEQKLPRINAPVLVVRGGRDAIVPQRWAEEATSLLPKGELVVIPKAPHVVNYTTPEPFCNLLREFARRV